MASIQGVYLALFGRPADPLGLAFFNQATNNGANLSAIGDLASTAEYQNRFSGQTNTQIINSIYKSLFNRDADLAGLTFFSNALAKGTLNINNIAIAIFDGAQGTDVTIRDLKVAAANAFTAQIDTSAEVLGYQGNAAAASGVAFIQGVTSVAPTEAQVTAAVAAAVTAGQTGTGGIFALTSAIDVLGGTGGNDTFIGDNTGANPTIQPADNINGGGGFDIAQLFLNGGANNILSAGAIERFDLQAIAASTFNAQNVVGAEQFWSKNSTAGLTVSNVKAIATVGVEGGQADADGNPLNGYRVNFANGVSGADKTVNVALIGANVAGLLIGDAAGAQDFGTVSINGTGGASTIGSLLDGNGNAGTTSKVVVTGDSRVSINAELTNVTTIDASASTGGARVRIDTTKDVTFTGGKGGDRVDVGLAGLTAADKIDGGDGTDTLRIRDGAQLTTPNASGVKGFEGVNVTASATSAYNMDALTANNTLTFVSVTGDEAAANTASTITVNNLTAAQTGAITIGLTGDGADLDNVTFTAKNFTAGGLSDTATITFDNTLQTQLVAHNGTDVGTLSFVDLDVLNIVSKSDGSPVAGEQNSITSLVAPDLNKVVITGDQSFSLTTAAGTEVTEVDASGLTGALDLQLGNLAAAGQVLVTGTTKDDTIVLSANASNGDTVRAGAGSDTITLSANAARDTVASTATAFNTGDILSGNVDTINNFSNAGAGLNAADDILKFDAGVNNLLKVGGVNLGATAADVILNQPLSATTNVAAIDDGVNTTIQFDINGDGVYNAGSDYAVVLNGITGVPVTYNATGDFFYVA